MLVYRLTKERYSYELSGYGASLSTTNRWNRKGTEMIYTATSRALAMAEVMPHLALDLIPTDFVMMVLHIPDTIKTLDINIEIATAGSEETQSLGEDFIRKKEYLLARVPSKVVAGDYNILINPLHPAFGKIRVDGVQPFPFDSRLFYRLS